MTKIKYSINKKKVSYSKYFKEYEYQRLIFGKVFIRLFVERDKFGKIKTLTYNIDKVKPIYSSRDKMKDVINKKITKKLYKK